ncbi:MAG: hypothetical protein ACRCST_08385 [Turicibacter sp.]
MACLKKNECSCPKVNCVNHGLCCECVKRHRAQQKLPFCLRDMESSDKEK